MDWQKDSDILPFSGLKEIIIGFFDWKIVKGNGDSDGDGDDDGDGDCDGDGDLFRTVMVKFARAEPAAFCPLGKTDYFL